MINISNTKILRNRQNRHRNVGAKCELRVYSFLQFQLQKPFDNTNFLK
jgi:hypothetical protein